MSPGMASPLPLLSLFNLFIIRWSKLSNDWLLEFLDDEEMAPGMASPAYAPRDTADSKPFLSLLVLLALFLTRCQRCSKLSNDWLFESLKDEDMVPGMASPLPLLALFTLSIIRWLRLSNDWPIEFLPDEEGAPGLASPLPLLALFALFLICCSKSSNAWLIEFLVDEEMAPGLSH